MSAAVRGVRRRSSGGWPAFWGLLAALAAEAAGLGLFAVSGWFIASCAIAGAAITSFSFFEPSAVVRTLALARIALGFVQRLLQHRGALQRLREERLTFFDALAVAPPDGRALRDGALLDRAIVDADTVSETGIRATAPLLSAGVLAAGAVALLAARAPMAALALAVTVLVCAALVLLRPGAANAGESRGAMRAELVATVDAWPELAALGASAELRRRASAVTDTAEAAAARMQRARRAAVFAPPLVAALGLAVAAAALAGAGLDAPEIAFAVLLATSVLDLVSGAGAAVIALRESRQANRRLAEMTGAAVTAQPTEQIGGAAGIRVADYRLPDGRRVTTEVGRGGLLLVTGPSGSGKTTLLRAIAGAEGAEVAPADAYLLLVSHAEPVFTGTVASNLRLGDPSIDDERARVLLAPFDLEALDPGTPVGIGGRELSGGELRRLSLARAVAARPDVLLVDEPTAGLDAVTAPRTLAALRELLPEATVVLAVHEVPSGLVPDAVLSLRPDAVRMPQGSRTDRAQQVPPG